MTILQVSDHALLRFFERGHGLPVEVMRAQLAAELAASADIAQAIGREFSIKTAGLVFLVKSGVVVTVLDRGSRFHPDTWSAAR